MSFCLFSFPEILVIFVVGIPIVGDDVNNIDSEVQESLNLEFEMFGDILQVIFRLFVSKVKKKKCSSFNPKKRRKSRISWTNQVCHKTNWRVIQIIFF